MKNVKVCMATIEFPPDPGGVGQSVMRIGKMLREIGCEVHVVVFHTRQVKDALAAGSIGVEHESQRGFDYSIQDGLHVHRSRVSIKSDINTVSEYLSDVSLELRRLHDTVGFDVFHAFFINETGLLTTLLAKELGVPVINSIRGSDLHKNIFHHKYFNQIVWALENSSWITFVSRELETRAHALAPKIVGRTTAFWNSVVPIDFDALIPPASAKKNLKGLVIGSFGRFRDKKGIDYLIRACSELRQEFELTLLLVGDFVEKERQFWLEFIRKNGVQDIVVVTGMLPREHALAYFELVDVFALPSIRDGCPNALLEAMLAGTAIIGGNVDAIGEIIDHEVNGLTVKPASTEELVNAIRRLAVDPKLRQRLGQAARHTALEQLSPSVERNNWITVYKQVLEDNKTVKPRATQAGAIAGLSAHGA